MKTSTLYSASGLITALSIMVLSLAVPTNHLDESTLILLPRVGGCAPEDDYCPGMPQPHRILTLQGNSAVNTGLAVIITVAKLALLVRTHRSSECWSRE